jgi:hypothetical protein
MMGRQRRDQGRLFYEFRLEDRIPENHLLRRINVFVTVALEGLHKELEPHYSEIGASVGRPRTHDPNAHHRLLLGHPLGTQTDPGSGVPSGVSMVLQIGSGCSDPASLDLLRQPVRPLPRERCPAPYLRACGVDCHGNEACEGRRFCRQLDFGCGSSSWKGVKQPS